VIDAGHGAAYRVAPLVFQELGASVTAIGVKPNGVNINRDAGALHPDNLRALVVRRGAHVGIALDGDADRVIIVDEQGQVVDGDAVMAMCASRMVKDGELRGGAVVATVMSNLGLEIALREAGIDLARTAVGDRYVKDEMDRRGAVLGGEQSGHVIFRRHARAGDGLVTALQVLALWRGRSGPFSRLFSFFRRMPQVLVNVRLAGRSPFEGVPEVAQEIRRAQEALGDRGRVLVRWSGTEPVVRVMVEGEPEERIHSAAEAIAGALRGWGGGPGC
jgi:phosphoglucosamine mutase